MASFRKLKNGNIRAEVYVDGKRSSKCFLTKREAQAWAATAFASLKVTEKKDEPKYPSKTLKDALLRYTETVSTTKKGERWEVVRANAFIKAAHPALSKTLHKLTSSDIADWRDSRLKTVSNGTVIREMNFISAVLSVARREWCWMAKNPCEDVRRPKSPPSRETTIKWTEILKICKTLGYKSNAQCITVSQSAAVCFLVALRTGARAGELTSLTWPNVKEHEIIVDGKTGKRAIPINKKTRRLLNKMRGITRDTVFGIKPASLDALFRKAKAASGLSGFTFHDARHTAATRLCRKVDVLTLCKIFGWKNPKMAMVYYNPKSEDIAKLI